jgi:hypothetical protein
MRYVVTLSSETFGQEEFNEETKAEAVQCFDRLRLLAMKCAVDDNVPRRVTLEFYTHDNI